MRCARSWLCHEMIGCYVILCTKKSTRWQVDIWFMVLCRWSKMSSICQKRSINDDNKTQLFPGFCRQSFQTFVVYLYPQQNPGVKMLCASTSGNYMYYESLMGSRIVENSSPGQVLLNHNSRVHVFKKRRRLSVSLGCIGLNWEDVYC